MPLKFFLVLIFVVGMEFVIAEDGIFQGGENGQQLQKRFFAASSIDDSVLSMYENITLGQPGAPKYAAFEIVPDTGVVIDEALVGSPAQTATREEDKECFDNMISLLTDAEPRFILYAFGFTGADGTNVNATALITWISDLADLSTQTFYNAMLDAMRQTLPVQVDVVAYDLTDLNYDVIADEAETSSK